MTEDRIQDGDELNFDDEEFIIEDLEGDDEDIFAEADLEMHPPSQAPTDGAGKESGDGDLIDVEEDQDDFVIEGEAVDGDAAPDVDDILFEALNERSETSEFNANLGADFSDTEAGEASEIEQFDFDDALGLGSSSTGQPDESIAEEEEEDELFALEDEDIELIDGDMELAPASSAPSQSDSYTSSLGESEEDAALFDSSLAQASLDDPESFAIEEEDPIYGTEEQGVSEGSLAEGIVEDVDYSAYEDDYIEKPAEQEAQLLGGGQGRRFPFRAVASFAAVLMIAVAGGVVFLKPEWLGLYVDIKPIEVVEVARPSVDVNLVPPEIPAVATIDPVAVTPPDIIEIPIAIDPIDPIAIDPIAIDPIDPIAIDPIAQVDPKPPTPAMQDQAGPIQVGEFLSIGLAEPPTMIEPMVSGKRIDLAALQPGSEAFAELPNAAFFIGTVRKLNVSHVTLVVGSGEVTFAYDELVSLTSLAEAGVALNGRSDAQHGYVRLVNKNRLYGLVIQAENSDKVLLESENSQVRIPMDAVDKIGVAIKGGVDIPDQEDDAWMQKQIRERMLRDRGQSQRFVPGAQIPKPGRN